MIKNRGVSFCCFLLAAGILVAQPTLTLQISNETAPSGGWAQFKVSLPSPQLITSGGLSMDFDPTVFGDIASAAVFSATGDSIGYAYVSHQHLEAHFISPSGGIGQLPNEPVFVVTVPVLPGVAAGTKTQITANPTVTVPVLCCDQNSPPQDITPWIDQLGNQYAVTVNPAAFIVGGSLSVQDITPGGGLLPADTLLELNGTGFDATTAVSVDGVAISSAQLVSPKLINVTLGGATELTGKRFHITNAAKEQVDYSSSLPSGPMNPPAGLTGIHFFAPLYTSSMASSGGAAPFESLTGTGGVVMLNQNLTPVMVTGEVVGQTSHTTALHQIPIAPGEMIAVNVSAFATTENVEATFRASAPLRMLEVGSYTGEPYDFAIVFLNSPPFSASLPLNPRATLSATAQAPPAGVNVSVSSLSVVPILQKATVSFTVDAPRATLFTLGVAIAGDPPGPEGLGGPNWLGDGGAITVNPPEIEISGADYWTTPATVTLNVDATRLLPGTYYGMINIIWAGGTIPVPITVSVPPQDFSPIVSAIVNAGSETPGALSPGDILTIFGLGLGGAPTGLLLESNGDVASDVNGTAVLIDGVRAPVLYSSASQINAIVPYEVGSGGTATVQVQAGIASAAWQVPLVPATPAIVTIGGTGVGQAAVLNGDSTVNSASNPAARGSTIQIFATGAGQTSPPSVTGSVTQSSGIMPVLPVKVTVGGIDTAVQFAGSAPGLVAGVLQVNAVIPAGVAPGPSVPIIITVGGVPSQAGVAVAVK